MPCIRLTFFVGSRLLAGRELALFYTDGILDEGAIGDSFGTILYVLIGTFDGVLVYLNELFLIKKDMLHIGQRCFLYNYLADAAPAHVARPIVLAWSFLHVSRARTWDPIAHAHGSW